jgi:hypothetical protein
MCSYPGPRKDYHDDFDRNLDGSCGGCSDIGWTTQYEGWTSLAFKKGKWKQIQKKSKLIALSLSTVANSFNANPFCWS